MSRYVIKRLVTSLIILWAVLTATFLLVHLAPGDPSMLYIRPEIDAKVVENIRSQMGFDMPVWKQYFIWIKNFIQGDFGLSSINRLAVFWVMPSPIR
jgi:peptide/nickel transport system permease protein